MQDAKMETFLSVCEYRNFTHAADALGLTQPAVSRQMKSLEEYYGVPLFRYEGKKLLLTDAGETLYRFARVAKSDENRLREQMRTNIRRPLRLGCTPTPGGFMLPSLLSDYLRTHPSSDVHICIQNTGSLLEKLDHDEIDLAIVEGNFPKKEYGHLLFSIQNYVPICSAKWELPDSTIESLLPHTLILREAGSGNREILESSLRRHNLLPSDFAGMIEVNNLHLQKELVLHGLGIAFVFEAAICGEDHFQIIPLEGFPLKHEINLVWRKDSIFQEEYVQMAQDFADLQSLLSSRIRKALKTPAVPYSRFPAPSPVFSI